MAIIHHLFPLLLFVVYLLDLVDAGSSCSGKNKTDGSTAAITTTTTPPSPPLDDATNRQSDTKRSLPLKPHPPPPPPPPSPPSPPTKTTTTTTTTSTMATPSHINPDGGCRVYTTEEKYKMLAELGSYNQIFMADTAEQAALNFAPVFKKLYGEEPYPDYEDVRIINGTIERVCRSKVCQTLLQKLKAPITEEEWLTGNQQVLVWADPIERSQDRRDHDQLQHRDGQPFFQTKRCKAFLRHEVCQAAGDAVNPRGLRLCTQIIFIDCGGVGLCSSGTHNNYSTEDAIKCQRAFIVTENCFPRYINAADCQTKASCIYNAGHPHGFTIKEELPMYLLRNDGTSKCEKFVHEPMNERKDKPQPGERVKINVGGTLFETYLSTLTRADGTVLSAMVASRWRNQEEIFIDRNPTHFAKILDYLRDSEHFTPPLEEDVREALRKEAEFYNLPDLAELCSPDVFHIGDNVQWKESAVESYWKLLLQLWFNRKYEDIFVWVSCVDCKEPVAQREYRGYVDSAFKHFVKSIHVKHHMLSAKGTILSLNDTCCRVLWENGWQTHLPQSVLRLAKK